MQAKFTSEDVLVRALDTPNPRAIKFVTNHALKSEGKATFTSLSQCSQVPLAEATMNIVGVTQIYFFENTMTVTHDETITNEDLKDYVTAVIKTRLPIHNPNFMAEEEVENKREKVDRSGLSPEIQAIEEVLDRTIRPGLQADGGDVDVISFKNNEIRILYQGACGGCPSAMFGTLEAIQGILQEELKNEELIVIPI